MLYTEEMLKRQLEELLEVEEDNRKTVIHDLKIELYELNMKITVTEDELDAMRIKYFRKLNEFRLQKDGIIRQLKEFGVEIDE